MPVDHYNKGFQASTTIAQYLRVKLSAGKLAVAGVGEVCLGTMEAPALVADSFYAVRLWSAPGTRYMVAAGAITQYAVVYGAADGKIDDTVNGHCLGIALEAATADGDIIEILPLPTILAIASASHIADPAACAAMTATLTGVDTGTDMTAAQAATIVADLAALKTAIDANNAAIDSILAVLENAGLVKTS